MGLERGCGVGQFVWIVALGKALCEEVIVVGINRGGVGLV